MPVPRSWLRALPLAAALLASPLAVSLADAQARSAAGPTRSAASVGARLAAQPSPLDASSATAPLQRRTHHSQAAALMIVGGAAVVVGLLASGSAVGPLLILGGSVVGLYGLYLYLQ